MQMKLRSEFAVEVPGDQSTRRPGSTFDSERCQHLEMIQGATALSSSALWFESDSMTFKVEVYASGPTTQNIMIAHTSSLCK